MRYSCVKENQLTVYSADQLMNQLCLDKVFWVCIVSIMVKIVLMITPENTALLITVTRTLVKSVNHIIADPFGSFENQKVRYK